MKNLFLALLVLVTTGAVAQKSLFDNLPSSGTYDMYADIQLDKNGNYLIMDQRPATITTNKLASGEGYQIVANVMKGDEADYTVLSTNMVENYDICVGYPFESVTRHQYNKDGFVAIGDYVFILSGISKDGTSYVGTKYVFIKSKGGSVTSNGQARGSKKKFSFKDLANAVKDNYTGSTSVPDYGPAHKELSSKNLKEFITDYLVAMKAKQDGRSSAQKQGDANIEKARTDYNNGITAYNDSTKATPEYQDLQRRIAQNEANYQGAQKANKVTLRNNSGSTIYVGTGSSKNRGTEVPAGGTAGWNCDQDAYIQSHSIEGGSNAYRSTSTKVYSKNTGCGDTVNIN